MKLYVNFLARQKSYAIENLLFLPAVHMERENLWITSIGWAGGKESLSITRAEEDYSMYQGELGKHKDRGS